MDNQDIADKVNSELKKLHVSDTIGGYDVEKIELDDLPFPLKQPFGIDRILYAAENKVDLSVKETKLDEVIHKLFELKINYLAKYAEEPTHIFMSHHLFHNLIRLYGNERYCVLPHMNGGNPPSLLGMTVVFTISGADNQVFLSSGYNMFLFD